MFLSVLIVKQMASVVAGVKEDIIMYHTLNIITRENQMSVLNSSVPNTFKKEH